MKLHAQKHTFEASRQPSYCSYGYDSRISCAHTPTGGLWLEQALPGPVSAVADFTGDGRDDLLLFNETTRTREVFSFNNRTFERIANFDSRALGQRGLPVVGDWNGDGLAELMLLEHNDNGLEYRTMLTTRVGTGFAFAHFDTFSHAIGSEPFLAARARITNDRRDDLLLTNHETDAIKIFQWSASNRWEHVATPAGLIGVAGSYPIVSRFNPQREPNTELRDDVLFVTPNSITRFDATSASGHLGYRQVFARPKLHATSRWPSPEERRILMLKCRYADDARVPHPNAYYEQLLYRGIVPFMHDMTQGAYNLSNSYVDPNWHTTSISQNQGRGSLAEACLRLWSLDRTLRTHHLPLQSGRWRRRSARRSYYRHGGQPEPNLALHVARVKLRLGHFAR